MQMISSLKQLAEVRAGHPFRGSVPLVEGGNTQVIQMRDVSPDGAVAWTSLSRTDIPTSKSPDWLRDGDILFVARGARYYAVCLSQVPPCTVCAQHFFVLRGKGGGVLPEYLAWHINRAPSQRYLRNNAEGSDQLSIRRAVLEELPVAVPELARQRLLVDLAAAAVQERRRFEALIHNRERELDLLAQQLFSPPLPDTAP
jgi:restriction endonuclease S subunit